MKSTSNTSKVYFTPNITKENLVEIYKKLGRELQGKVAVKIHSGEHDKGYIIQPEFMKPLVDYVKGTIVECNTAYDGRRNTSEAHWKLIKDHGFTDIANVDLLDENGEIELPIPNGLKIKKNFVGKNLEKYDSILMLSHFKGHQMGGFGGALKNTSIGLGSSHGKAYIHGAGIVENIWTCKQEDFLESMADAVKSIMDYRKDKIVFINVMKDMSIDCDCNNKPTPPAFGDIGILASLDPVALDQACVDKIYSYPEKEKTESFRKRMEEKKAIHILEAAETLGIGSRKYELITF